MHRWKKALFIVAATAVHCSKPIPESWKAMGLPLEYAKVADGTMPSDKSLYLSFDGIRSWKQLCDEFKSKLEATGYAVIPAETVVQGDDWQLTLAKGSEKISLDCFASKRGTVVRLDRR